MISAREARALSSELIMKFEKYAPELDYIITEAAKKGDTVIRYAVHNDSVEAVDVGLREKGYRVEKVSSDSFSSILYIAWNLRDR